MKKLRSSLFVNEECRIREAYAKRDAAGKQALYAWHRGDVAYISYRERAVWAQAYELIGINDLEGQDILDVGCGTGRYLRMLLEWGASPWRLHGVDLLEDRIARAKVVSPPGLDLRENNGWPLPYPGESMDLCAASTVFSSILDLEARRALAKEMVRVIREKGWVMIFDYVISDPGNADTIGIGDREIRTLFPGLSVVHTYRLILAPPLLRKFHRRLLWVAHALEICLPFLCSHRLYVLKK